MQAVDNCSSWNAARGFLVTATIAAAFAFIVQLLITCTNNDTTFARVAEVTCELGAAISGIVSMAMFIQLRNHDGAFTSANSSSFAYGFTLLVVGWVLALSALPFSHRE